MSNVIPTIETEQYDRHLFPIDISELGFDFTGMETMAKSTLDSCVDWVLMYTGLDTQYVREEFRDGNGRTTLVLSHYPAQSLQVVKVRTFLENYTDITEYCRLMPNGELELKKSVLYYYFPEGKNNLYIQYTAGLTRIPPVMRMVIIELAQTILFKMGIMGAIGVGGNPAIDVAGNAGGATTNDGTTTKGIKLVKIKSLEVAFTDDTRNTEDAMNSIVIKKATFAKIIDDILRDKPGILKRLDKISKVMFD